MDFESRAEVELVEGGAEGGEGKENGDDDGEGREAIGEVGRDFGGDGKKEEAC